MILSTQLVLMVAFGLACALLARGRGRSGVAWFFLGWLFHLLALILLLVLPDLSDEERRREALSSESRRVRERQHLDRQAAERRHEDVRRRLAVHDRALGIDTEPEGALQDGAAPPPLPPSAAPAEERRSEWFFAREGAPVGPLSRAELRRLAHAGGLDPGTLVWAPPLVDWRPAGSVPGLLEVSRA